MIQDYYQILGIPLNASVEEVKKAFRRRAKELHPDLNPAPDAQEKFIELSKAYEFLLFYKSSGREGSRPDPVRTSRPANPQPPPRAQHHHHQGQHNTHQWNESEAQKRAEAYARMKYKEFVNSPHYKETMAFETAVGQIFTLLAYALIVLPSLIGLFIGGWRGLLIGAVVTLFSSPVWGGILRERYTINLKELGNALLTLVKTKVFTLIVGPLVNVILFFTITDWAVVPTWVYPVSLLASMAACLGFYYLSRARFPGRSIPKLPLLLGAIAPGLVNLFFILNYSFSSAPQTETYYFDPPPPDHLLLRRSDDHDPWLTLERGQYNSCHRIRLFWNVDEVFARKGVHYTMEKGLFGIKVVKKRKTF